MPQFGILRGFSESLFGDKLFAGQTPVDLGNTKAFSLRLIAIMQVSAQTTNFVYPLLHP
jgi:hypothetical protein